ncbi:MAG: family 43 glycosylhydrolase [Clostridia bacterium]|nr:family 43 glycosylhydrolase [Clostridia bacterium]
MGSIDSNKTKTYCNPLALPDIPRGKDDWYRFEKEMFSHENKPDSVTGPDYRSVSDPTVMFYDNKWYLYPSYGMAWVTEDFQHWKHIRTEPYCPKYSPAIIPWKGRFLLTSWCCPLYVSDDPLGPFELLGDFIDKEGNSFTPCDPCLFADDDGRIYLYAFRFKELPDKEYNCCQIIGYELDRDDPRRVIDGPEVIVEMDPGNRPWERQGYHYQHKDFGWVEGPHLLKHNERYYMIYASAETEDPSYCMAVFFSDESPLHGFRCQKRNPLTTHRHGIVGGAGHGCVEHGPDNSLWAFYTIAAPYAHIYERRIGMDPVEVDENGELYCPRGISDTPQYIPGYKADNTEEPGCYNLTGWLRPKASSEKSGRDAIYAVDESCLTFWQAEDDDPMPTLVCDLMGSFTVYAVRLFWREIGLDYSKGAVPGPIRYRVEGFVNGEWEILLDRSDSEEEYNIDYRTFNERRCTHVRLVILEWQDGIRPAVIDFSVFGER